MLKNEIIYTIVFQNSNIQNNINPNNNNSNSYLSLFYSKYSKSNNLTKISQSSKFKIQKYYSSKK